MTRFLIDTLKQLQRFLVTGLMVWIPLIVTLWVAWWVISNVVFGVEGIIKSFVGYLNAIGLKYGEHLPPIHILTAIRYIPGTGFFITLVLFLTTGFFARYLIGRKFIAYGEKLVQKIPLISRIYTAVRQIRDVFVNREGAMFQEVVLIEYPRPGLHAVGFVTSRDRGVVQETLNRPSLIAVFLPTTPNPTSGFLFYVSPRDMIPLDITVEEAMKLIVSAGAYIPGKPIEEYGRIIDSPDTRE